MSLYQLNLACRQLVCDSVHRAAMRSDPAGALRSFKLTDEERAALISGDVEALHKMGVNNFLMGYLARYEVCGLTTASYSLRMRALATDTPF